MKAALHTVTALLVAVPALLDAGCATVERYEARETASLLAAAGFQRQPAETLERQGDVGSLPPHRIVSRTRDGHVVWTYADPDGCQCVYVGGDQERSAYERLRVRTQEDAARRLAGGSPSGGAWARGQ